MLHVYRVELSTTRSCHNFHSFQNDPDTRLPVSFPSDQWRIRSIAQVLSAIRISFPNPLYLVVQEFPCFGIPDNTADHKEEIFTAINGKSIVICITRTETYNLGIVLVLGQFFQAWLDGWFTNVD